MKNTDVKFERSKMTKKKKSLVIIPPVAASKNMSFVRHAIVAVISRSFLVSVLPCIWSQMCLLSKVSCGCANSALPSVSGKSKNSQQFSRISKHLALSSVLWTNIYILLYSIFFSLGIARTITIILADTNREFYYSKWFHESNYKNRIQEFIIWFVYA